MKTCIICGENFENHSQYANHIRWAHKNNEESKKKISEAIKKYHIKKSGEIISKFVECETCKNIFEISERETKTKERYFCSTKCAHIYVANLDKENKNLKRKATINRKIENGETLVKFPKEIVCKHCGKTFSRIHKNRKFCSGTCRLEFGRRHLSEKVIYRKRCGFNFSLNEFPNEFDFSLIEQYGWYSAKNRGNNINGISRDHMYSVSEGFKNNIDPLVISHPANCCLMRHNDNVSKYIKCSLTLNELLERIKEWNIKYKN